MERETIKEKECGDCKRIGELVEMCPVCLEKWFLAKMSA
jgi:RNA polymerase subunit RPABC4/transcription elongation factor Spt4